MSAVRMLGTTNPLSAVLVQLQAEIDSVGVQRRLLALEDPVSALHPDIQEVSAKLYEAVAVTETASAHLRFDDAFYTRYSKVLAILEAKRLVTGYHSINRRYSQGLLLEPEYFVYLCARHADQGKMDQLVQCLDDCKRGQWLDGKKIATALQLPPPVVDAMFRLYEAKGLGIRSDTIGEIGFLGRA
jgi:hypothetical protein